MKPLANETTLTAVIALSSLALVLHPKESVYILTIIIYIIIINLAFIGKRAGGESNLGSLLTGFIIVVYSLIKIINLNYIYLVDVSIAIAAVILASAYWNEELVRAQYSALYPTSMIIAIIIGYAINARAPFQLVLLSVLESHLVYHALSRRKVIEGLVLALLYAVTIYSLYYLQSQPGRSLPLLGVTFLLKVVSGMRQRLVKVYAPLDFYLKVIAGGMRV